MLTLTGVTKTFGERRVLDGLDLEIGAGESVAMLGANGSGKTTTLRCIVGLARPDAGRIVDRRHRPGARFDSRARASQLPAAEVGLSADADRARDAGRRGAAARHRRRRRRSRARRRAASPRWRTAASVTCRAESGSASRWPSPFCRRSTCICSTNRRRISIPSASRLLFQRARQLKRDGHTLLFTTHIPADVRHLATRIVLLRDGRIESEAAGQFELRRYERMLERDMWGDEHEDLVPDLRVDAGVSSRRRVVRSGVCRRSRCRSIALNARGAGC